MKQQESEIIDRLRDVEHGRTAIDDTSDLPQLAANDLERLHELIQHIYAYAIPDGERSQVERNFDVIAIIREEYFGFDQN